MAEKVLAAAPMSLPMGFADQILDLEMSMQEEQNLETIQILMRMYQIGVEYYLNLDYRKAKFFQNKLNKLALKSLSAHSVEATPCPRDDFSRRIKDQMQRFMDCEKTYVRTIIQQSAKSQKKIKDAVEANLNQQESTFQNRMLKRVKSSDRL